MPFDFSCFVFFIWIKEKEGSHYSSFSTNMGMVFEQKKLPALHVVPC